MVIIYRELFHVKLGAAGKQFIIFCWLWFSRTILSSSIDMFVSADKSPDLTRTIRSFTVPVERTVNLNR